MNDYQQLCRLLTAVKCKHSLRLLLIVVNKSIRQFGDMESRSEELDESITIAQGLHRRFRVECLVLRG